MNPTIETEQRAEQQRQQIEQAMRQRIQNKNEAAIKQELDAVEPDARLLENELNIAFDEDFNSTGERVVTKPDRQQKATTVKESVQQAVVAIKEGKFTGADANSTEVLKTIANIPIERINERSAPYIYRLIKMGQVTGFRTGYDLVQALRTVRNLKNVDFRLYSQLVRQFEEMVPRVTPDTTQQVDIYDKLDRLIQREQRPRTQNAEQQQPRERQERGAYEGFNMYYSHHFSDQDDIDLIYAIFHPEDAAELSSAAALPDQATPDKRLGFLGYMKKVMQEERINELPPDQRAKALSDAMELKMVQLFSKLFSKVDEKDQKDFFEQVIQADPQRGIQSAYTVLSGQIDNLANTIQRDKVTYDRIIGELGINNFIRRINLVKTGEEKVTAPKLDAKGKVMRDEKGEIVKEEHVRAYFAYDPNRKDDSIDLANFVRYLSLTAENEMNVRSYTHNATAIMYQPTGGEREGGFYGRLKNYANRMKGYDIDAMNHLPDADIVSEAKQLYLKFLTEEFAKNDWRHRADLFQPQGTTNTSELQDNVLKVLKQMHGYNRPDGEKTRNDFKTGEEWRLKRALYIAIGQARGVILAEQELAGFADPAMNKDGKGPSYISYYLNEDALTPFNALHSTMRWQAEGTMPFMLFFPISKDGKTLIFKNHSEAMRLMTLYRNSYVNGRGILDDEKIKVFADFLVNPGQIGGMFRFGGFRVFETYNGFLGEASTSDDHWDNWKIIENIGYEVLTNYIDSKIDADFLGDNEKNHEFMEHLYNKYVLPMIPPDQQSSFENYLHRYHDKAHHEVEHKMKHNKGIVQKVIKDEKSGKQRLETKAEAIHREMNVIQNRLFLNRVLAGVAAQRFGTKIVLMERDRFTSNGERTWQLLRKDPRIASWAGPQNKDPSGQKLLDFDKVMKNIAVAETKLRQEISTKMHDQLRSTDRLDSELLEMRYNLTPELLERYLSEMGIRQDEMDRTKEVFEIMRKNYSYNDNFLNEFAEKTIGYDHPETWTGFKKGYPFALGAEELDMSFLTFKGPGERALFRNLNDVSTTELNLSSQMFEYWNLLKTTATDGKKDFSPLIEKLQQMKTSIEYDDVHKAYEVIHNFAAMTINYFKLDEKAKPLLNELRNTHLRNSIAAEFAGQSAAVWEWGKKDIDHFIDTLETNRILPELPYDLNKDKTSIEYYEKQIGPWKKMARAPDFEYSGHALRDEFKVGKWELIKDTAGKVLMAMAILALILAIREAWKELHSEGGGGGGGGGGGDHH